MVFLVARWAAPVIGGVLVFEALVAFMLLR
jgi:hypothetical protein